ncbi:TolC family outer membrane protein [Novosphingopyxis sp.]|uniref:TolC family outer membrane protein n=1 Tax=Novosphingopyxis sp. TaxID=2709690 RepID=UPI003B5B42B5
MRNSAKYLLAAAIGALIAAPAGADTLREALIQAYQNNPTITGQRAQQRATDETLPIAKADGRPNLTGSGTFQENLIDSNPFSDRQFAAAIDLAVPVYSGGAVKYSVRAADKRVDAGRAELRGTESSIFSQTVSAYMNVIRDDAIVRLNRANVGVLTVNREATSDRFQIGDLTRTDVAQAEARLAIAQSDLETARSNLIQSKENYIELVGAAPDALEPPPPLPNLPETASTAVDIALDSNPDLIAAHERRKAAAYDVRVAEAGRLPRVSAFTQGSYANFLGSVQTQNFNPIGPTDPADPVIPIATLPNTQESVSVGVRANIPLYQGGRVSAQTRRAQALLGLAQEQEIAAERSVVAQVRSSYASWQAALQVIQSSQVAVESNQLALEGVRAENSVGNRTILDILNAEQELLNSQVQLVTARRNAYVAGFSLLAAMGRAEAEDLGLEGGILYDPLLYYNDVRGSRNDWSTQDDPEPAATRTVDTLPQNAPIEALPKTIGPEAAERNLYGPREPIN